MRERFKQKTDHKNRWSVLLLVPQSLARAGGCELSVVDAQFAVHQTVRTVAGVIGRQVVIKRTHARDVNPRVRAARIAPRRIDGGLPIGGVRQGAIRKLDAVLYEPTVQGLLQAE